MFMITVKEIKRVLYILVDISLNILRGPFACIVFKPEMSLSKVDIVSRGLTSKEINDYGHQVAVRAFSKSKQENWDGPFNRRLVGGRMYWSFRCDTTMKCMVFYVWDYHQKMPLININLFYRV